MRIGLGMPNPIAGVSGRLLIQWARRAEERGFHSLATIDRIAYPSYESLATLAAAAAVTRRIGLLTNVLIGPVRNPVLLAKEAASVDQLSEGRLTLGVGVGGREDDYEAVGSDFGSRGRRWDRDLEIMHRVWKGELVEGATRPVGPRPVNGDSVPLIIGGMTGAAIERAVKWGTGWTMGGGSAERGAPFANRVRRAWKEAGRQGDPRIVGLVYFGLAERALEAAAGYLGHYYGERGAGIARAMPKTAQELRDTARTFEDAGFGELVVDPTSADLEEVDRASDALL